MTRENVLVTGGAGFVGSHLVDALVARGHRVRILDNLEPQVHGPGGKPPAYLNPEAEFVRGDVRDRATLEKALAGIDVLFHEAAAVGVGQSMYQIWKYMDYNATGGAMVLDVIVNTPAIRDRLRKLVVASSMSIYGEGAYRCPRHGDIAPELRPREQLAAGTWEMLCPVCGEAARPLPTPEAKPLQPTSIYAISKRDHEEMFLATGRAYKLPAVALRYFNIYGPRQALSNPYTGVCAIFSGRLLNGNAPVIYEDGLQSRDFVHVRDIVQANLRAMDSDRGDYDVFNVGTGRSLSILEIARTLIAEIAPEAGIEPVIEEKFREGDVRHCFADIAKIRARLGYEPSVEFAAGMAELTSWVRQQQAEDGFEAARDELRKRGLA